MVAPLAKVPPKLRSKLHSRLRRPQHDRRIRCWLTYGRDGFSIKACHRCLLDIRLRSYSQDSRSLSKMCFFLRAAWHTCSKRIVLNPCHSSCRGLIEPRGALVISLAFAAFTAFVMKYFTYTGSRDNHAHAYRKCYRRTHAPCTRWS